MDITQYLTTFGQAMKKKHGCKVHKLSVNAEFSCPNRDGSKGIGGCTFCNIKSFSPETSQQGSVTQQLERARERVSRINKAQKFLAYFQAYSNTYAQLDSLKALYDEALAVDQIIGLAVGTRPDCVANPVMQLLADYQNQGKEIWLELGLQSSFDESLIRVNRGHGFAEYADAIKRAQDFDLQICTHLIVGLPGEKPEDTLESVRKVLELGVQSIKIHPLHITKGTQLAREWKQGLVPELDMETYCQVVAEVIKMSPKELIFHRLHGAGNQDMLLAPQWCGDKWRTLDRIHQLLQAP